MYNGKSFQNEGFKKHNRMVWVFVLNREQYIKEEIKHLNS